MDGGSGGSPDVRISIQSCDAIELEHCHVIVVANGVAGTWIEPRGSQDPEIEILALTGQGLSSEWVLCQILAPLA